MVIALVGTVVGGIMGHIPVICRGFSKGCVILPTKDFALIQNGDAIISCGSTGIVATSLMAVNLSKSFNIRIGDEHAVNVEG